MVNEIDNQIINMLKLNARMSFAEIGRRIGLSPSSIRERIQKLEDSEVIEGYIVKLNHKVLDYDLEAFILVKVFHGKLKAFLNYITNFPEIKKAHRITGSKNVHLTVVLKDQLHLQNLIDKIMIYGDTETLIVLSEIKGD